MKTEPHDFQKIYRGIPWLVCRKCGLVRLRNPFTDWCVRNGCYAPDRPDYKRMMSKLTQGGS